MRIGGTYSHLRRRVRSNSKPGSSRLWTDGEAHLRSFIAQRRALMRIGGTYSHLNGEEYLLVLEGNQDGPRP